MSVQTLTLIEEIFNILIEKKIIDQTEADLRITKANNKAKAVYEQVKKEKELIPKTEIQNRLEKEIYPELSESQQERIKDLINE